MSTTQQTAPLPLNKPLLKIFISYSQQDISIVKELYDRLILEGLYDIYWDQLLKPGENWPDTLTKKLKESDVILFCISRNSNTSQYVQNELNLAIISSKEHILIPVRLDNSPVPQRLATVQWVDLFSDKEQGYRSLLSALHFYTKEKQNKSSKFSTEILPGMRLGLDPKDSIDRIVINDRAKEHIEDDRLNFAPYVRALYEFIKAPETTTPLAISINGAWGTGKSSLMSMLMQELEPAHRNRWQMHWQWNVAFIRCCLTGWLFGCLDA